MFAQGMYAQSIKETQDYLVEKIEAYSPTIKIENRAWFNPDISLDFFRTVIGYPEATEDLFRKDIFIYSRVQYFDEAHQNMMFEIYFTTYLSQIEKISIIKDNKIKGSEGHILILYFNEDPFAVKCAHVPPDNTTYEFQFGDKFEIPLSSDKEDSKKIKKAFIHLAKEHGVDINDGDIF